MAGKIDEWREAGFSEEQIQEYIGRKSAEWRGAGFGEEEINGYLGRSDFDPEPLKKALQEEAEKEKALSVEEGFFSPKGAPPKFEPGSFLESVQRFLRRAGGDIPDERPIPPPGRLATRLKQGVQSSVPALIYRNKLPEIDPKIFENMPIEERIAMQVGTLAGDLPVYATGAMLGSPGGPVSSMAGAFGLAAGLRQVYTDKIEKGEISTAKEFLFRLNDSIWETMKGLTVGGATGAVGAGAKPVVALAKEIPTMVGLSAALDGRVPEPHEFVDAALLLVPLKFARPAARYLREHYARTGEKPSDVAAGILQENAENGMKLPYLLRQEPVVEQRFRSPRPMSVEERLGLREGALEEPVIELTDRLRPDQRALIDPTIRSPRREDLVPPTEYGRPLIQREAETGYTYRPEGFKSAEGPGLPPQGTDLFPDQKARTRGEVPPTAAEMGLADAETVRQENIRAIAEEQAKRQGLQVGRPPEAAGMLPTTKGRNSTELSGGIPFTPEQRYWQNWNLGREINSKSVRVQDIADEALRKVGPIPERERVVGIRDALQSLIDEGRKRGEPRRIVGDPEGVGREKVVVPEEGSRKIEKEIEGGKGWVGATVEGERLFVEDVFVEKGERRSGLGEKAVREVLAENPGKEVWIASTSKGMDRIAEKLGFEKVAGKGRKSESLPDQVRVQNAKVWRRKAGEEGKPTASYAYTWDLGGEKVDYYEVKGGPLDGSSLPVEQVREMGLRLVKEKGTEVGRSPLDLLKSEDGFVDLRMISEGFGKLKDIVKLLEKEAPYLLRAPFYSGKEGAKELYHLKERFAALPWWQAKRDPRFKPYEEIQNLADEARSQMTHTFLTKVSNLYKLHGKDYGDYRTLAIEGDRTNYEYRDLQDAKGKLGREVSQKAFEAYKSVRATFDEGWELLINSLRKANVDEGDLQALIGEIKKVAGYFPRTREGKRFINAEKEGAERVRAHFDNEGQGKRLRKELEAEGYRVVEEGEVPKVPEEMYSRIDVRLVGALLDTATENWQPELKKQLMKDVSEVIKSRGFLARGISRDNEYVKGFEAKNLKKVVMEHFLGLSGMIAKVEAAKKFREQFYGDIGEGRLNNSQKANISKFISDMLMPTSQWAELSGKARAMIFARYMWGVVRPAVVNLTGGYVTAWPRLALETKSSLVKFTDAMNAIVHHTIGEGIGKGVEKATGEAAPDYSPLKPEEMRSLRIGLQKGWNQDMYTQELMGKLKSLGSVGWAVGRTLGGLMSVTEKWLRLGTHLAAFRVFRNEHGLSFEDATNKARDLVYDAHGKYGKSNLPGLFRGSQFRDALRTAYTFRTWQHNFINLLGHFAKEKEPLAILRSIAAIGVFGGLGALPFYKAVEGLLSREGINPRSDIKKWAEDEGQEVMGNFLLYGLPGVAGIDLSGSLGLEPPGERAAGRGSLGEIASQAAIDLFGLPAGIAEDTFKAAEQLYNGDLGRAIEESPLTPTALANFLSGSRMEKEGLTTRSGELIRDERGMQIKLGREDAQRKKFLGFQSVEMSEHYRQHGAKQAEIARWEKEKNGLTVRFKKAVAGKGLGSKDVIELAERIGTFNVTKPLYISQIDTGQLIKDMLPVKVPGMNEMLLNQEVRQVKEATGLSSGQLEKVKTAQQVLAISHEEGQIGEGNVVSPAVKQLLGWAKEKGVVSEVLLQQRKDMPGLGIGTFYNDDKTLAVIASGPNTGNVSVLHELIHAIVRSDLPSNTGKMQELEGQLSSQASGWKNNIIAQLTGLFDPVILPKHWTEGKVDNPFIGSAKGRAKDLAKTTLLRRFDTARQAVPEGEAWSGLTREGGPVEEGQTYYLTDPSITAQEERAKELGMLLADVGVPMPIVEAVVEELKKSTVPKEKYSGGGVELRQLKEKKK